MPKMSKLLKISCAVMAVVVMFTAAGCKKGGETAEPESNMATLNIGHGDTFAEIKIKNYGTVTVKLFTETAPVGTQKFIERAEYYKYKTIHRVVPDLLVQGGSFHGDGNDALPGNEIPESELFAVETGKNLHPFAGALMYAPVFDESGEILGNYSQFFFVTETSPVMIDELSSSAAAILTDTANLDAEGKSRIPGDKTKQIDDFVAFCDGMPQEVKDRYATVGGIPDYDGKYTVFGQVINGMDVLKRISEVETRPGNPIDDAKGLDSRPLEDIVIEEIKVTFVPYPETTPVPTTVEEETTKKSKKEKKPASTTAAPVTADTPVTDVPVTADTPVTAAPAGETEVAVSAETEITTDNTAPHTLAVPSASVPAGVGSDGNAVHSEEPFETPPPPVT